MENALVVAAVVLLLATLVAGWMLTLMGLPGTWLMVAGAGLYYWVAPTCGPTELSASSAIAMLLLATFGEIAEFAAGAWGARRAGGSRRAALFGLIGSIAGAIGGALVGLPIPVFGAPIAALLGGALGALLGAGLAEHSLGEDSKQSLRVGKAAFLGRLLGTGAKSLVATMLAVIGVIALLV